MRLLRYPLKALADLRERRVEDASRALGTAVRATQAAEAARVSAIEASAAHGAAAASVLAAEHETLAAGALSAGDLARIHEWSIRVETERRALTEAEVSAASNEAQARGVEATARERVGKHKADAEVVARDEVRWHAARQQRIEAGEEESAVEAWRSKG